MRGEGVSEDESSGSERRHKRRKPNPNHRMFQDDGPAATNAPPAAQSAFAAKMMAKMGYVEGQGLGATGKGRLAPIDAQMRPQGVGLGTVKEKSKQAKAEEKREAAFQGRVLEDSSEEERKRKKERKEKRKTGLQGAVGTPKPAKQKYRTAAEIEAAAEGLHIPNVLKSIIDATGQETRMLSSASGLMGVPNSMVPAETESMKLSRKAHQESVAFAEEWRDLQERKDFFATQQSELESSLLKAEDEESLMERLSTVVESLQVMSIGDDASWELVIGEIESVSQNADAGDNLDIQKVAVAVIHPLFKRSMQDWDPLENPQGVSPYLQRLQDILQTQTISDSKEIVLQNGDVSKSSRNKSTTPYETMIYTLWLPVIRTAVTSWDVYQPDQLIGVLESWQSILPPFILANVVDQLVEQRLASAISTWKPKRSRDSSNRSSSPQQWLFPWLQYLDEQHTNTRSSTGLMADVKRKLKSVFSTWDIGHGVFPGLQSWQAVFKFEMPQMLTRYILKNLAEYFVVHFDLDPADQTADQKMKPFEKVLEWVPYFPIDVIGQLFSDVFFKKWHNVLYMWLVGDPNHAEIMEWYQWWKNLIHESLPEGFNDLPMIKKSWEKGLTMINVALDAAERGLDVAAELHPIVFEESRQKNRLPSPQPAPPIQKHIETPTTFKDVVEDWCAENGLLMFPLREADLSTGLPLFRITASASGRGGAVLYLKGDVAWVRSNGVEKAFMPMALDDALVAKAEGR